LSIFGTQDQKFKVTFLFELALLAAVPELLLPVPDEQPAVISAAATAAVTATPRTDVRIFPPH
jgi:hypothetical protein